MLKISVILWLLGELVGNEATRHATPRAATVYNCSPDFARFPQAVVGLVVFETYVEGYRRANHREREPWNSQHPQGSVLMEDGKY